MLPLSTAPPQFTSTPDDVLATRGDMIRLTCTAMAFPAIHTVVWRKNGTTIGQLPPYIINTVTSATTDMTQFTTETTLSIENAQKEDSGVYECELTNNFTSITSEARVYVQGMQKVERGCAKDVPYTSYEHLCVLFG